MQVLLTYLKFIIILIVVPLLTENTKLHAQNSGVKIAGVVKDAKNSEPIVGANIIIERKESDIEIPFLTGTATDINGEYTSPKLQKGDYIVKFRSIGYEEKIENITIARTSGTLLLNIDLISESFELDEVLVQDKKQNEEIVSVIDISPKQLSMLPSMSGEIDIFRSLQLLPGVKIASEMSNGIYVRGGSPDQNLTLVDGTIL